MINKERAVASWGEKRMADTSACLVKAIMKASQRGCHLHTGGGHLLTACLRSHTCRPAQSPHKQKCISRSETKLAPRLAVRPAPVPSGGPGKPGQRGREHPLRQQRWGSGQGTSPGLPQGLQHAPIRVKGNYVKGWNSGNVHRGVVVMTCLCKSVGASCGQYTISAGPSKRSSACNPGMHQAWGRRQCLLRVGNR